MKTIQETKQSKLPKSIGEKQEIRNKKGQFIPGVSGNPYGRPLGTKNFSTDFDEVIKEIAKLNNITESEARKILLRKAYSEAKNANFPFYKDIMDRYYGQPKNNELEKPLNQVNIQINIEARQLAEEYEAKLRETLNEESESQE